MHISQEKLDEFQGRMSNWVASQGLLFQLRHGGSVQGAQSSVFLWFARMLARLLVLALVVVVGFWVFLAKRIDFSGFRSELNETIAAGLRAEEATAGGISRTRGSLEIGKITLTGGAESFFDEAMARGVRTKMGLLDGVISNWNGESVKIEQLEMSLKAGAEDAARGAEMFGQIFKQSGKFQFSLIDIEQATLSWGYSELTEGKIEDAKVRAQRQEGGWRVSVTGGVFRQNWLQGLEIVSMDIMIVPSGIEFREVKLTRGHGELNFQARIAGPITEPALSGSGKMRSFSIDSYLVPQVRERVGADLSGTFTLGGSPYGASGVTMSARIELEGDDRIELRSEHIPLFTSISLADRLRSYKNVRFRTGRFTLETGGGVAVIKDIWLNAEEVMQLEGGFLVRPPTQEEVNNALRIGNGGRLEGGDVASTAEPAEGATEAQDTTAAKELSLEELRKLAQADVRENSPMKSFRFNEGLDPIELEKLRNAAREREMSLPMLQGTLRIGLNGKAFEPVPELTGRYPIDLATGIRWLEVPLKGSLYEAGKPLDQEILEAVGRARGGN